MRGIVARQHGLVTSAQVQELGYTRPAISRRSTSGAWKRLLPGVYEVGGSEPRFEQRAYAALLWAGEGAALSHMTAAGLWQLAPTTNGVVELWVPPKSRVRNAEVRVHRGLVVGNDRRLLDGFAITSAGRTLVDIAGRVDEEMLESMTEEALRRGLTTEHSVRRCLDRVGGTGRAGSGRLRALLEDRGNTTALESRLEVKIWRLLRGAGLRPVRQHPVRYDSKSYRLDFAWPALRVAVEADGFDVHGGSRAFERDHARLAVLAAHGWLVVPVTWRQVTNEPAVVLDAVISALRAAAA